MPTATKKPAKKYVLVRFTDNWADEFDVNAMTVLPADEWEKKKARLRAEYPKGIWASFGTNEGIDYENADAYLAHFTEAHPRPLGQDLPQALRQGHHRRPARQVAPLLASPMQPERDARRPLHEPSLEPVRQDSHVLRHHGQGMLPRLPRALLLDVRAPPRLARRLHVPRPPLPLDQLVLGKTHRPPSPSQ